MNRRYLQLVLAATLILDSGCVAVGPAQVPKGAISKGQPAVVVSVQKNITALIPPPSYSHFGVIGLLVAAEATEKDRSRQSALIREALGDFSLEKVLREGVVGKLISKGYKVRDSGESVSIPPRLAKGESGDSLLSVWYTPDKSIFDHTSLLAKFSAATVIEIGFGHYSVVDYGKVVTEADKVDDGSSDKYLEASVLVKLYDANGNLLGRAESRQVGTMNAFGPPSINLGRVNLDNPSDIVRLAAALKEATNQTSDSLLTASLNKLGL